MCNGCKLIKMAVKKKKFKGKKKYFILDEDLMGFRYKPSKKPRGYKGLFRLCALSCCMLSVSVGKLTRRVFLLCPFRKMMEISNGL